MSEFTKRYQSLNAAQQQAVDTTQGPLLVIAGPGTGKTELLSMRAANILQKTDTAPENILLLTFTESGAAAMRERLAAIIGPAAYKVAIHTFHGFGTDIISQNREYFYNGATYQPADDITRHELLQEVFDTLDYSNPLASKNNGDYVYLRDTATTISELKNAGLTSDELLQILDANDMAYDSIERTLSSLFESKISIAMAETLAAAAQTVATTPQPALPAGITPMANILALSLAHAVDAAAATKKTTAITAWRNDWMEKDADGRYVFKDRKRSAKLRAVAYVYFAYLTKMNEQELFDYDDMVLNVIHAIETRPDLRANLQEKFQYIMVDEFQDTNLAQLRLLFTIASGDQPNVMAVGDDDQAIYSFQGADVNNIHKFRERFNNPPIIVLTDNYRSTPPVLTHSRQIITQGSDRLETTITDLSKALVAQSKATGAVTLHALPDSLSERAWVAEQIQNDIKNGVAAESIAVIARRHAELTALTPHLSERGIAVNYERRDNVLNDPLVQLVIQVASAIQALHDQQLDTANALLPDIVSHPAFGFSATDIWQLSLAAYKNRQLWLEAMSANSTFQPFISWLTTLATAAAHTPLEAMLDTITGTPDTPLVASYESPIFSYYFGDATQPERYFTYLESLRTIRAKLREYQPNQPLYLDDFLHYIDVHQQAGIGITSTRKPVSQQTGAVNVLTAHKSKGLEYQKVYVIGAVDSSWGEKVRAKSRLISYPKNLAIAPAGDTATERLRLFYVAMTRAKQHLTISYATADESGKLLLPAAFLAGTSLATSTQPAPSLAADTATAVADWRGILTTPPAATMQQLLAPVLQDYKLSATHLNNFLDVTKGGPQYFLLNNLLHFPSAKSPSAQYGTAIHATLQYVHNQVKAGATRPIEDVLHEFEHILTQQRLAPADHALYLKKGLNSLTKFLEAKYSSFTTTQKTELGFGGQGVVLGAARLTGSLDLVDSTKNELLVTDYKTGTPTSSWQGKTEYEKIKLHHYRQQLMFYQLLVQHSRDYAKYAFAGGVLQFVEPDRQGNIHALQAEFGSDELAKFTQLINGVWQHIIALDFPDITSYEPTLKGILQFESDIIDKTS